MLDFLDIFLTWQGWVYLFILSLLEVILGIDNIIFISIVTSKLEKHKQRKARNIGLSIALFFRLILLFMTTYIMHLTDPLFTIPYAEIDISGQSIILILGGLFLMYKSITEMHNSVQLDHEKNRSLQTSVSGIITQIILIDLIFSLDSIISAVGMTNGIETEIKHDPMPLIVIAIIISMVIMLLFAGTISRFINEHPNIKMIALSFLVAIGILLIAEGIGEPFPKGYVYFALMYALFIEFMNIRLRKKNTVNEKN